MKGILNSFKLITGASLNYNDLDIEYCVVEIETVVLLLREETTAPVSDCRFKMVIKT